MLLTAGSAALACLSLASMWLLGVHRPTGWVLALAAQVLWVPYDTVTKQYGFLAITAVSVPVYIQGWRRWRRDGRTDGVPAAAEGLQARVRG